LTKKHKTHSGEKTASSTNGAGETGYLHAEDLKLDPCLSPCANINSKWIKDFNLAPKSLKPLLERIGKTL
jgi:hypothetical protein